MICRAFFAAALAGFSISVSFTAATAAPEIVWEVENRFRFYKDADAFKAYMQYARKAGDQSDRAWIVKTERKLQDEFAHASWEGWAARWRNSTCWDRQTFTFGIARYGDRCHDYALPASHRVIVSVKDAPTGAGCNWAVASFGETKSSHPDFVKQRTPVNTTTSCRDVAMEVPYAASGDAGLTVRVTLSEGEPVAEQRIVVTDLLVLGMGDSFGAGVGNPDRPPRLAPYGIPYDDFVFQQGNERSIPVRVGGYIGANTSSVASQAGEWLDIRCFRSQYGPQFRSAMHLAISLPHAAVTFIDLACDGARIIEGLLNLKSLGSGFAGEIAPPPAQIGFASRLLCANQTASSIASYALRPATSEAQCRNLGDRELCEFAADNGKIESKYQNIPWLTNTTMRVCRQAGDHSFVRQIDVVLLSIGGNDIGFAPMVGDVIMDDKRAVSAIGRFTGAIHSGDIGRKRLELLESKYRVLDRAMRTHLPIRNALRPPIFLTAYPIPVDDREGALCGSTSENARASNAALDIDQTFARFAASRTARPREKTPEARLKDVVRTSCLLNLRRFAWFDGGRSTSDIVTGLTQDGAICGDMREAADGGDAANKLKWQYVAEHLLSFKGHGFCAHRADQNPEDVLAIPKYRTDGEWRPALESASPYRARQRWVRTPNDAFSVTNWHTGALRLQDFLNLLSASTTSAMHPTAEGYAAMADAILGRVSSYLCEERSQDIDAPHLCDPR